MLFTHYIVFSTAYISYIFTDIKSAISNLMYSVSTYVIKFNECEEMKDNISNMIMDIKRYIPSGVKEIQNNLQDSYMMMKVKISGSSNYINATYEYISMLTKKYGASIVFKHADKTNYYIHLAVTFWIITSILCTAQTIILFIKQDKKSSIFRSYMINSLISIMIVMSCLYYANNYTSLIYILSNNYGMSSKLSIIRLTFELVLLHIVMSAIHSVCRYIVNNTKYNQNTNIKKSSHE